MILVTVVLVVVSKAFRRRPSVHRIADGDIRSEGWEVQNKVQRDLRLPSLCRRAREGILTFQEVGLLPPPPNSVEVCVVEIEKRVYNPSNNQR